MLDIEKEARILTATTGCTYMEWLESLSAAKVLAPTADLRADELRQLASAAAQPARFLLVCEGLAEYAKEHPEERRGFECLAEVVDESLYSLGEWLESLDYFYAWLGQEGRVSPGLPTLLHYLGCCAEAGKAAPTGYPLRGLLEEMLDQYGFQSG